MLERFAEGGLGQRLIEGLSQRRRWWKMVLPVVAVALLSLALARPQYGTREETVKRRGMDIVIAIDTSDSMLAEDIRPNRLRVAKKEISRLIDRLKGDRIGIVPFAGDAFVQCPLTLDYGAAKMFLESIDTNTVSRPGTALGQAIEVASRCFVLEEQKYKVLILITDGDNTVEQPDPLEAVRDAAEQGVRVYTIGIGSRDGVPIPVREPDGTLVGYKEDQQGQKVLSRLNEKLLRDIALKTDSYYSRVTTENMQLDRIVEDINQLEQKELQATVHLRGIDRFQYVLFPAILLLFLEPLISERVASRRRKKS